MEIAQVALMGIVTVLIGVYLKQSRPEYSYLIGFACTLIIFFSILSKLSEVIQMINTLQNIVLVEDKYIKILFKMIGITYVGEFSQNICKDAGYASVANQIETFAKICIMYMSMPVIMALLETVEKFF
ncbi:MAG: stage III sporulation AC/AD family protein [Lachnospiraceae bacterium]|nr:stage III sporulation protein AD [Lachnospira sp.]MBQ8730621.1 stage III sporulation AC/AD family protein [Lachnospiraceae bacterium]MBR6696960.1 stage III sporulation AC/AD family protein [Lachnospiraceae bacterium]